MKQEKRKYVGVNPTRSGKWEMTYCTAGKRLYGGMFETQEEAYLARCQLHESKVPPIPVIDGEEWLSIPNHDGYMISDHGRVKALNFGRTGEHGLMKQSKSNTGYMRVFFGRSPSSIHRLVWGTFNTEIPDGNVVHHKNGDKLDNRLSNLECVTVRQNSRHYFESLGHKMVGVSYHELSDMWMAAASVNGERHRLGYYKYRKEAYRVYVDFLSEHGIDP